ncbi:ferredoxin--NADP reductase [Yeosuana sp. MJ-SS3]|jgi:ring-1,2-phenylacetyl-CoA epoxidase subunit PaaE|uniref:Ferredoxin--NADP reductase n=1 Tax=Gilvirhabdus luticola TaxID=3079858 RepID=A0ABU3U2M0_9FLAO|nr:ferredoxin--NADP reductase [Yeosuana sp. MJ-SS3]MDU8884628.1 ferredoxin--NADP reductase [Yeosuana sp. MJ-SS3]
MSQFHKLTIKEIKKVTQKAVTISFNVPENLKDTFSFKAGQYITLKTSLEGQEIRRDYSLCSSSKSGELKVAVKAVEHGVFSKFANSELKVNDVIEVSEPNGRFTFEPDQSKSRTISAFAAGSGITPIMSIVKTVLEEEPLSNFILIYGNKTPEDTIFYNELLALQTQYNNRLKIQFVFSQAQKEDALFGRIDKSVVNFVIKNLFNKTSVDTFYLCGPEAMIYMVKDVLIENHVSESNIKFELFTVATPEKTNIINAVIGQTNVRVMLDDEEFDFVMDSKKTVLEAALSEKIDAPYSCQGGICSSCLARLKEGQVTMRQNNILTDSEVAEGLILTCQSQPTTSIIYVDYDDV